MGARISDSRRTEYEFSWIRDEPVARILGEYSFEYIVFAWQVSTMNKISLYLCKPPVVSNTLARG